MNFFRYSLRRSIVVMGLGILGLHSAQSYAAKCEYVVQSDWNNGFVASIRITNNTSNAINGWSVNWGYNDGSSRTGGWNANFSGSNPYTASNLGWNSTINPGQMVEFGLQGTKGTGNTPAPKPVVSGIVCNSVVSSLTSSSVTTSTPRSSVASIISSRSSSSQNTSIYTTASYSSRSSSSYYQSTSQPFFSSSRTSASSSHLSSSSYSSSAATSSTGALPTADFNVTVNGLTVFVDSRISSDPLNRPLRH